MKNGIYTVYCIQSNLISESPWLKPNDPLVEVKSESWAFCGERWCTSLNPYIGCKPKDSKASKADEQWRSVYENVGLYGWFDIKMAYSAIKRVQKDNDNGVYDSFDGYKHHNQARRYRFRIVKIDQTFNRSITVLPDLDKDNYSNKYDNL
jgi:hypothetical protein